MDKLTLEHLAPYLPYGLKMAFIVRDEIRQIETIRNLHDIENYDDIKLSIGHSDGEHIWMYKPILRPLSDLTKEIEHNGKSFAPIEWFEIGDDDSENWFSFDHGNINLINDLNIISTHQVYHDINFLPYAVVQKLIEWHFDLFELIEKGLALDVNQIDKSLLSSN